MAQPIILTVFLGSDKSSLTALMVAKTMKVPYYEYSCDTTNLLAHLDTRPKLSLVSS